MRTFTVSSAVVPTADVALVLSARAELPVSYSMPEGPEFAGDSEEMHGVAGRLQARPVTLSRAVPDDQALQAWEPSTADRNGP